MDWVGYATFALAAALAVLKIGEKLGWLQGRESARARSDRAERDELGVSTVALAVRVAALEELGKAHTQEYRAFEKEMRERSDKAADRLQAAVLELESRIWRELAPRLDRLEQKK